MLPAGPAAAGPAPVKVARLAELPEELDARDRLTPVQLQALAYLLQGKTKGETAELVGRKRNRITVWCNRDENFKEAYREALADVRGATVPLLVDGFRQGVTELVLLLNSADPELRMKAAAHLTKLYRPEPISEVVADAAVEDHEAEWLRLNTQAGQAFLPHEMQLQAINCLARYLVLVAGVQSGKTASGARNFWRRILAEDNPHATYWMVAPTTGIGRVMRRHFVSVAPKGWLPNPEGAGADFEKTWILKNGARVEFHSANKATNLVAETVSGAWLDEFTMMKSGTWHVSLRARLATTSGWAVFTGTPRGPNWGFEDIWRRTQADDDLYDTKGDWVGFTWHSSENPLISTREVEDAKSTLPDAFYRREWEASWEAFHGQVFPDFTKGQHVFNLETVLQRKHEGELIDAGVDWGYGKPGALVVGRYAMSGAWDVLHEVHEAKRLEDWWVEKFKAAHLKFGIDTFWCDSAEPDRITGARRKLRAWARELGIPVPRVKSAKKQRWEGIRHCAKLFKAEEMVRVHRTCEVLTAQLQGYKFKEDRQGDDLDEIEKGNDHTVDAFRYMVFTRHKAGRQQGGVVMGSA